MLDLVNKLSNNGSNNRDHYTFSRRFYPSLSIEVMVIISSALMSK